MPTLGQEDHNDCTRNRPNSLSSFIPSFPAQSPNGTSSLLCFFSPFTRVLPELTRLQPPQPAAGPHLSMNIKIMYIVLTTSAPVFHCFNNTQGTDHDHFLTHVAAGLATLCKSPVLYRKNKNKFSKRYQKSFSLCTLWWCVVSVMEPTWNVPTRITHAYSTHTHTKRCQNHQVLTGI